MQTSMHKYLLYTKLIFPVSELRIKRFRLFACLQQIIII